MRDGPVRWDAPFAGRDDELPAALLLARGVPERCAAEDGGGASAAFDEDAAVHDAACSIRSRSKSLSQLCSELEQVCTDSSSVVSSTSRIGTAGCLLVNSLGDLGDAGCSSAAGFEMTSITSRLVPWRAVGLCSRCDSGCRFLRLILFFAGGMVVAGPPLHGAKEREDDSKSF